ncbi:MAG: hypothetical protein R2751_15210 [Bacteroidales bacterium]
MTVKAHFAVIAGELAPGTTVSREQFSKVPDLIRASFQAVNRMTVEPGVLKYEILRMDEFMGLSENPLYAMRSLIMLIGAFRFLSFRELGIKIHLRASLGLGPVEFAGDLIRESDGTAFRNASHGLEKMKRDQHLVIHPGEKKTEEEFNLTCRFMDILIRNLSDEQSEALFLSLSGKNQSEISQMLGISQPAVNRRLKAANAQVIQKFIARYETLLKPLLRS